MSRPTPFKTHLARSFRKEATEAEEAVWRIVRDSQLLGLKFRRQHVIDGFIVDFFCPEHRLILEVDGTVHDNWVVQAYDHYRVNHFRSRGLRIVRIRNENVSRQNLVDLIETVLGPGRLWPED